MVPSPPSAIGGSARHSATSPGEEPGVDDHDHLGGGDDDSWAGVQPDGICGDHDATALSSARAKAAASQ
jgi:hypothetical protein